MRTSFIIIHSTQVQTPIFSILLHHFHNKTQPIIVYPESVAIDSKNIDLSMVRAIIYVPRDGVYQILLLCDYFRLLTRMVSIREFVVGRKFDEIRRWSFDCGSSGLSRVRVSQSGNWLPNPRFVRTALFPDVEVSDFQHTLAVMEWGQIIAHDVTLLSMKKGTGSYSYLSSTYLVAKLTTLIKFIVTGFGNIESRSHHPNVFRNFQLTRSKLLHP